MAVDLPLVIAQPHNNVAWAPASVIKRLVDAAGLSPAGPAAELSKRV